MGKRIIWPWLISRGHIILGERNSILYINEKRSYEIAHRIIADYVKAVEVLVTNIENNI